MASFSSSAPPAPAPAASHPAPRNNNNNNNNHKLLPAALIYLAALTVDSDPTLPAAARAALHSSHHAHTQRFVATLVAATGASFHALQLALHYLLRVRNATSAAAEAAAVDPSLSTKQPSAKPQLKHLAATAAITPLSPPASPAPTTTSPTAATTTTQTAPPPHRRRHHHPTTSFTAALLLALKYLRDRGTPPARVLARLAGVPLRDPPRRAEARPRDVGIPPRGRV
ncbi:hypothetical protein DFJ73DRAFT_784562 [Zopfochytrium polystomum]|nr:hypothetical protein DFJ73DRAFT_784562 [Zopfochytrium polystomum]